MLFKHVLNVGIQSRARKGLGEQGKAISRRYVTHTLVVFINKHDVPNLVTSTNLVTATQLPATCLTNFPGRLQHSRIIETKLKTAMFRVSWFSLCPQNSHKLLSTCYVNARKHTDVLRRLLKQAI